MIYVNYKWIQIHYVKLKNKSKWKFEIRYYNCFKVTFFAILHQESVQ